MINIGTDPEFFILDKKGNAVPAHKFFEDKHNKTEIRTINGKPTQAETTGSGGGVKLFRDGFAVELNAPGSYCRALLARDVCAGLQALKKVIGPDYTIASTPAVKIDLAYMKDCPEDVKTFGCDPSLDAYTGEAKYPSINAMGHAFRYAGGHLHFSVDGDAAKAGYYGHVFDCLTKEEDQKDFVKMLDLYVGLPLAAMFDRPEAYMRRKYYGQAGEYRNQKYPDGCVGVEYRTPGPEVWNHNAVAGLAFGVSRWVVDNFDALREKWNPKLEQSTQHAINTGKGLFDNMQTVPYFYTPDTIKKAAALKLFGLELINFNGDTHTGWTEFVAKHKLGLPPNDGTVSTLQW